MYDLGSPLADLRVPDGTNLLVVGPPLTGKRALAYDVLAHGVDRDEAGIVVSNTDGERGVREALADRLDRDTTSVGIVDCVSRERGIEPTGRASYAAAPDDMTGAGIGLSEQLDAGTDRGDGGVRVVLDSITPLLVYANLETTFRFLHVCTTRIETAGGLGVHLVEAGAHGEGDVETLTQLYDGVVRTADDEPPAVVSTPPGAESP